MLYFEPTKMPSLTLNNIFNFKKNPSVTVVSRGSKWVCVQAQAAACAARLLQRQGAPCFEESSIRGISKAKYLCFPRRI